MNTRFRGLVNRFPFLVQWKRKAGAITLPGFDGIPLYDVYRFFVGEIRANSLPTRSKSIAFSFFLAFFPALTFIFTLIPYIPYFKNVDGSILNLLQQVLPNKESYSLVKSFVEPLLTDLARHKRGVLLTGSIFLVLFLTSNGVMAMMSSFDKSYEHYSKRNALQSRYVALKITFLLILLFILSILLIVMGQGLFAFLVHRFNIQGAFAHQVFNVVRYVVIAIMFFLGISLIYYYGPATKKKYRFISTGSTVATILSILVSTGFSLYVSNFNKLNVIFGSIGTIMLLLIWLNINAFVLLIGYEINASIHYNKTLRTKALDIKHPDGAEAYP